MNKIVLFVVLALIATTGFAQKDTLTNKSIKTTATKTSFVRPVAAEEQIGKLNIALSKLEADLKDISAQIDKLKNNKDALSEMGEEQQLKMQMLMDRMTKADNAASNMLKKFSEIASQIIGNMK